MKYTDGYFYLRRLTDPDMDVAGASSMLYTCREEVSPCCTDDTAECIACSYGITVVELCADDPDTAGCPQEAAPPAPSASDLKLVEPLVADVEGHVLNDEEDH